MRIFLVILVGVLGLVLPVRAEEGAKVVFVRDIQPIFEKHCVSCHGPEKQKGRLRFDSKQSVMAGGQSGAVLKAGDAGKSLLIERVLGLGGEDRMPLKADPLSEAQVALLKRWIEQGADWPDEAAGAEAKIASHWAYVKPKPPALPEVKEKAWIKNDIDRFILARLEKEGLRPSPAATKEALIRRVSLDLIGLPPTPKEIDEFLADNSANAYEKLVDRLLASPHYGERWARPWLDMARYADTHGFEADQRRVAWKYRDWVIEALNRDMSFKQFTIEQIAGDMLEAPTQEQLIATGFHRNTMKNEEGGVDQAEARWLNLVDRVGTTAQVFLGTTLQCAQCHNHKYDPFTQVEFYQLLAAFENAEEPTIDTYKPEDLAKKKRWEKELAEQEKIFGAQTPELAAEQSEWEKSLAGDTQWTLVKPVVLRSAGGSTLSVLADGSVLASGTNPKTDTYEIVADVRLSSIQSILLEVLPHESLVEKGPGRATSGNFILSEITAAVGPAGEEEQPGQIKFQSAVANFAQGGYDIKTTIDGKIIGDKKGWAVASQFGRPHIAMFAIKGEAGFEGGTRLHIRLHQENPDWGQHGIGRFRVWVSSAARDALPEVPPYVMDMARIAASQRSEVQKQKIEEVFRSMAPSLKPTREKIAALKQQLKALPKVPALVMKEKDGKEAPSTLLRNRGSFLSPGDKVYFATPKVLHPLRKKAGANRLDLAKWLVDEENPLTARVTVNRYCEAMFGSGIVETADDFGIQGSAPTHPELLDYLAVKFMKSGWSMKGIKRLIVTSATYQQASRVTPELLERDPYNRLLARGARVRMEAEMVRDAALAASGLLSRKMFGPSVFPPQPEGVWDLPYNADKWVAATNEDRYRRGLYTFWRRSAPYAAFVAFDAPSREFCTVRRVRTNTPLQALVMLNDPAYFEMARAMAKRVFAESPSADTAARVAYAFRLVTGRKPTAAEQSEVGKLLEKMAARYAKDAEAARSVVGKGELPKGASASEFAAWTMVANTLLCLDTAVMKE